MATGGGAWHDPVKLAPAMPSCGAPAAAPELEPATAAANLAETRLKTRAKRRDRASLSNKKPDFRRVPPAAPVFPLSYVITVHFKDGTSQSVSRSITTFEIAR